MHAPPPLGFHTKGSRPPRRGRILRARVILAAGRLLLRAAGHNGHTWYFTRAWPPQRRSPRHAPLVARSARPPYRSGFSAGAGAASTCCWTCCALATSCASRVRVVVGSPGHRAGSFPSPASRWSGAPAAAPDDGGGTGPTAAAASASSGPGSPRSHGWDSSCCAVLRSSGLRRSIGSRKDARFFASIGWKWYFCCRTSSKPQKRRDLMWRMSPRRLKYVADLRPREIRDFGIGPSSSTKSAKWSSSRGYSSEAFGSKR
mmetsp:Transcript_90989/g.257670  ORF Transcript_90989/g.257670 Transcript_90989/m.257670 type:complete len:259 (-) Transcript_90989:303-1079(-)